MDDSRDIEWAQRITRLEGAAEEMQKSHREMAESQKDIKDKLDALLELKSKGMGAFWLVSAIFGTGILGGVVYIVQWLKGG